MIKAKLGTGALALALALAGCGGDATTNLAGNESAPPTFSHCDCMRSPAARSRLPPLPNGPTFGVANLIYSRTGCRLGLRRFLNICPVLGSLPIFSFAGTASRGKSADH